MGTGRIRTGDRRKPTTYLAPHTENAPPLPRTYFAAKPGGHEIIEYEFLEITRQQWLALWQSPVSQLWGTELEGLLCEWATWRDRFNRGGLQNASVQLRRIETELLLTPAQLAKHRIEILQSAPQEAVAYDPEADEALDKMLDEILKDPDRGW